MTRRSVTIDEENENNITKFRGAFMRAEHDLTHDDAMNALLMLGYKAALNLTPDEFEIVCDALKVKVEDMPVAKIMAELEAMRSKT